MIFVGGPEHLAPHLQACLKLGIVTWVFDRQSDCFCSSLCNAFFNIGFEGLGEAVKNLESELRVFNVIKIQPCGEIAIKGASDVWEALDVKPLAFGRHYITSLDRSQLRVLVEQNPQLKMPKQILQINEIRKESLYVNKESFSVGGSGITMLKGSQLTSDENDVQLDLSYVEEFVEGMHVRVGGILLNGEWFFVGATRTFFNEQLSCRSQFGFINLGDKLESLISAGLQNLIPDGLQHEVVSADLILTTEKEPYIIDIYFGFSELFYTLSIYLNRPHWVFHFYEALAGKRMSLVANTEKKEEKIIGILWNHEKRTLSDLCKVGQFVGEILEITYRKKGRRRYPYKVVFEVKENDPQFSEILNCEIT